MQGVTLKLLRAMDHDHDGEVTRDEFLSFLLIKLSKAITPGRFLVPRRGHFVVLAAGEPKAD